MPTNALGHLLRNAREFAIIHHPRRVLSWLSLKDVMAKRKYVQKNELKSRIAKIQGQISGIQRMMDEGRPEDETLVQISALRAALDQLAARLVARHLCDRAEISEVQFDQTLLLVRRLLH